MRPERLAEWQEGKQLLLQHHRVREARLSSSLSLKESRDAFKAEERTLEADAARILVPGYAGRKGIASLFSDMHRAATSEFSRDRAFEKARSAGVQKMILMNSNTGEECSWCLANEGTAFSTSDDINAILDAKCTCTPYPKCVFTAVVEGVDLDLRSAECSRRIPLHTF